MTAGRRGVGLTPMETRRDVIVEAAVLADELGYETFAVPEGWGLDSTPVLAEIALRTSRIQVASGVLSVWGRTPATLAMTAATLHHMSAGRYVLGLGASTQALAEGFHDVPFAHPADRLRDVLTAVRALLEGQPAELRHVPEARPLRLGQPPVPGLPIWIAALGPRATQVAAELGDGWIPALVARDRLPAWAARLRRMRAAAAPDTGAFTVAAGPIAAVADDAAAARDIAASCVAWYLSGMGGVYARSVAAQGYAADVAAVIAANPRPSPRRGTIPPEARAVLDQLAACGTGAEVREQVERWDHAADVVTILLPLECLGPASKRPYAPPHRPRCEGFPRSHEHQPGKYPATNPASSPAVVGRQAPSSVSIHYIGTPGLKPGSQPCTNRGSARQGTSRGAETDQGMPRRRDLLSPEPVPARFLGP